MKSDPLYQFLSTIALPLRHQGQDIVTFLQQYYNSYCTNLRKAINEEVPRSFPDSVYNAIQVAENVICDSCSQIIDFLVMIRNGKISVATTLFDELMQTLLPYLPSKVLTANGKDRYHSFYRLRFGAFTDRSELFHIPISKRHLIRSYRYSAPGQPCLYLANAMETCFFECGMPKNFTCAQFNIDIPEGSIIKLIDFSIEEQTLAVNIDNWLSNYPSDEDKV